MENRPSNALPGGGAEPRKRRFSRLCAHLPQGLIFARYAWPLLTALTLFVMGWFYNIPAVREGQGYQLSLVRLYGNTLSGTHAYLGGTQAAEKTRLLTLLSAGAIVGILIFLVALFFAGLAAYTACRAFLAQSDPERANRFKLVFKIAFPNRVCLFLSNALLVLPALYPHYYAAVSAHFLTVSKEATFYLLFDPPLLVVGVMTALSLLLALLIPRWERQKDMNMFLIVHGEKTTPEE